MASTLTVDNIVGATTAANVKMPVGSVLQVVNGPAPVARLTSTSTSYTNTPVTATITPKYNTSKILVRWNTTTLSVASVYIYLRLMCAIGGGSQALVNANETHTAIDGYNAGGAGWTMVGHEALHSPNTTSACVYTLQSKSASGTHYVGWGSGTNEKNMMNITLMEISV